MREDLNGSRVLRRDATVFVKLPRGAWREIEHGCQCQHCKAVPGRKAYWDTLAVSAAKPEGPDTGWLVHQPEGHPEALRGDEVDREGRTVAPLRVGPDGSVEAGGARYVAPALGSVTALRPGDEVGFFDYEDPGGVVLCVWKVGTDPNRDFEVWCRKGS